MAEKIVHIKAFACSKHIKDHKYCKASDICKRDLEINDLECKEDHCTDQDRKSRSFSDGSMNVTDEQIFYRNGICCESAVLKLGKCSCSCNGIDAMISAQLVHCKIGHFTCERNHQEASCSQCRVHKILSKSAKKLLYNDDRKSTAKYRHPQRDLRRHIECKQKSCNCCTEISNGILFMHKTVIQPFKKYAGCYRHKYNKKCTKAEVPDTKQCGWKQCKHDKLHDPACCHFVPDMRIR